MHMSDALISPVVGGAFWAASAGTIAYCSARVREGLDDRKVPLMGVLGAFVFAAQMINFVIPATGSSGHIGGGLLLAILLGPAAAFLTIASVLVVQALFFADGGLLALGCNIFNLGVFPAFIAYPLIYKKMVGVNPCRARMAAGAIIGSVVGLQIGSLGVVVQTVASGVSSMPFAAFLFLMQPIHLAIGVIEGVVTALLVSFVSRARPEILLMAAENRPVGELPVRKLLVWVLLATLLVGGVLSWFASEHPDGLEWSIAKVTGSAELEPPETPEHQRFKAIQDKTAFLPDYALPSGLQENEQATAGNEHIGTSLSGIVGGLVTLVVCLLLGMMLKKRVSHKPFRPNH